MEEIHDGSYACCPGKIAMRHKVEFRHKHLLRRKRDEY